MGIFSVNNSPVNIAELISSWCDEKDFRVSKRAEQRLASVTSIDVEARPINKKAVSAVYWEASGGEKESVVQVRVEPNTSLSVLACLAMCACAGTVFSGFFYASSFSKLGFLSIMILAIFFGLLFIFLGKWLTRKQILCEDSFWEMLPKKELLRHVEGNFGPIWFELSFPFIMSVLLFLVFAVNKALVFGVFILSFSWCYVLVGLLDLSVKDSYSRWKMLTAHVTNRWIQVCFKAVMPFVLLCALNSLFMLVVEDQNISKNKLGVVLQEIVSTAFSEKAFSRTSGIFEEENAWILKSALTKGVEVAKGKDVSSDAIEKKLRAISGVMLAGIVLLLISYLISLRRLLIVANEWGMRTGYEDESKRISTPSVHLKHGKISRVLFLALITHYLLGSVITITAGLISLDAISYVISKHSLIIRPMNVLCAWIFTFGGMALTPTLSQIVGSCFLLALAFPFMVFFVNNIKRLVSFMVWRIMLYRHIGMLPGVLINGDKVKEVNGFIRRTCAKFGLTVPRLLIEEKCRQPIFIRGNLMSKISTIGINRNVLENLNTYELNAAIAHELGHLAQGMRKIEWLKLISVITMYSNYYLTLCLDVPRREVEADRFAISAGVDPATLGRAMVKTSMIDLGAESSRREQLSRKLIKGIESVLRIKGIGMVHEFFFGEAILGYTYPLLSERLAAICMSTGNEAVVGTETEAK
ncbi:MAG: hypothetical protein JXC85_04460 [Candidatus Aenigmarchaeota archaeon]|nr:hypothetical protein [Candidatus Aenigmarchaeota archaeon]